MADSQITPDQFQQLADGIKAAADGAVAGLAAAAKRFDDAIAALQAQVAANQVPPPAVVAELQAAKAELDQVVSGLGALGGAPAAAGTSGGGAVTTTSETVTP